MAFDLTIWRDETEKRLQNWRSRMQQTTVSSIYAFISAAALWPVVEAARAGEWAGVMALGSVVAGVGTNLLANQIQNWKDEADAAYQLEAGVRQNEALRAELDSVLEELGVLDLAQAGLSAEDRNWFVQVLRTEMAQWNRPGWFEAHLTGSGAIAQGEGAQAAGERGVVARNIHGPWATGDSSRVIQAGNYIEKQEVYQSTPGPDPTALRLAYLNYVFETVGRLNLAGVDPKAATNEAEARLNLGAVYTALLTLSSEANERLRRSDPSFGTRSAGQPEREMRRLSALAQLNEQSRLVLLGDPGSGKSTFVNFVAMCLAGETLNQPQANLARLTAPLPDDEGKDEKERQPWQRGALLPVRVILRDFAARGLPAAGQKATAKYLWNFITAELKAASLADYAPHLREELMKKGGLLLLDGLDEVPEAHQRRLQLRQTVEDFAAAFPRCRLLVTSRTYAYQKQEWCLPGFAEAVLAPFSDGQIRRFVDRWYAHIAELRGLHADDAQGRAETLKRAIFSSDRLRGLAERPLLLTLMASLHAWRGGSLPEKREELYNDTVDLLLDWWESPKTVRNAQGQVVVAQPSLAEWLQVDRARVRALLNETAFNAHAEQAELTGTADVDEGRLVSGLMRLSQNPDVNPARLMEYLSQRAGILLPRGVGVYTFPHRTFQEYLAACYLTNETYPDPVAGLARQAPDRWREVALLAAAKAYGGAHSTIWALVEALCWQDPPEQTPAKLPDIWGAHLAGQALMEVADLTNVHSAHLAKMKRVKRWLVYILEKATLPATERAIAGQSLAALGDDRAGIGLRLDGLPDIAWCDIPVGLFIRGSQDNSLSLMGKETPQQEVDLPAFRISRYPITNAQYNAFVTDGGYTETWRQCWTAAGWQDKGERQVPYKIGGVFDLPNHPVVAVTWYEAVAFCRWLTLRLRQAGEIDATTEISLPSESQWEKAARGTDGRVYPWGDQADPERANYGDTGIGSTTAVGCFPSGTSPYGVEEMSGTVWEWCRTRSEESYENYRDDNDLERKRPRVLRGGAFYLDHGYVRCAVRRRSYPDSWDFDFGFRVSLVSPF